MAKSKGEQPEKKKGKLLKVIAALAVVGVLASMCQGGETESGEDASTQEQPKTVTIEELTAMRDEVMELQEYDCASGYYQPVLDAVSGAQDVLYHTENPTDEQIAAAYDALVSAKENAVLIEDAEKTPANAALAARKINAGNSAYSREMTVYMLVNQDGYDQQTAEQGVDQSGIDWDEEAFQYVMGQLSIHSKITTDELISDMSKFGYTSENIAYALAQASLSS